MICETVCFLQKTAFLIFIFFLYLEHNSDKEEGYIWLKL